MKLSKEQTNQLLYITLSSLMHDVNHCLGNIDALEKNKFITGIKVDAFGQETTIGEMIEYQKTKLKAIAEFFRSGSETLHKGDRKNLPSNYEEQK